MKRCTMCGQTLPLESFHKNRARYDGLDTRCKPCGTKHRRRQYQSDPAASRVKAANYRRTDIERHRAYEREWARQRRQSETYRAYQRQYKAEWLTRENGRSYNQAKRRRRRSAELGALGFHTAEQLQARIAFYGCRCWICQAPYDAIDHVKPLTKGGSEWPANLRPICKPCNSRKNDRWPFP